MLGCLAFKLSVKVAGDTMSRVSVTGSEMVAVPGDKTPSRAVRVKV